MAQAPRHGAVLSQVLSASVPGCVDVAGRDGGVDAICHSGFLLRGKALARRDEELVLHRRVGVLGASSLVGRCLLKSLVDTGWEVKAFSRKAHSARQKGVDWHNLPLSPCPSEFQKLKEVPFWICVAPIWVLPEYFSMIEAAGAKRIVVLSSTSRFTKSDSTDVTENAIALRLVESEAAVTAWAERKGIVRVILRPTLIYGLGRDKNISEIAQFIRHFGFFPLFGAAQGLRQPVHAKVVATACVAAVTSPQAANRAYNISGGETLTYREMVARVFDATGRRSRFVTVPLVAFRLVVFFLRLLPRYRHWSVAMAERMNMDLVFDHSDAERDFGYAPGVFSIGADDLQKEV